MRIAVSVSDLRIDWGQAPEWVFPPRESAQTAVALGIIIWFHARPPS